MVLCNEMSYYTKFGRRRSHVQTRGFRLKHPRRIYIIGLRSNLLYMFRQLLNGFRHSYRQIMESLKNITRIRKKRSRKYIENSRSSSSSSSSRLRPFGRTNSFYTEAIADCIEFIKRSSVSVDDNESSSSTDNSSMGIEKNIDSLCADKA